MLPGGFSSIISLLSSPCIYRGSGTRHPVYCWLSYLVYYRTFALYVCTLALGLVSRSAAGASDAKRPAWTNSLAMPKLPT